MTWVYLVLASWMIGLLVAMIMLDIRTEQIRAECKIYAEETDSSYREMMTVIESYKAEMQKLSLRVEELRNGIKLLDSRTYEASLDIVDSVESLSQQVKNVGDFGMRTCFASEKTADKVDEFMRKMEAKAPVEPPVFSNILKENERKIGPICGSNSDDFDVKLATIRRDDGSETTFYTNEFYLKNGNFCSKSL